MTTPAISTPVALIAMPVITEQPQSVVIDGGKPATFSVTATSDATPTYQWLRAGVAIPGSTASTYTIATASLADTGVAFTVAVTNAGGTTTSAAARLTVNAIVSTGASASRLFSDQSLWNARPTVFTLGTAQIPTSSYYPSIESGQWSVGATVASPTDPAVVVMGPVGGNGLWVPDAEAAVAQITISHWPAGVDPASGADGHADIIDVAANRIHSFWQLKQVGGQWRATQYTWTPLDGTGWGTPAAYMQGSRAAGVPTIGGVIRVAELTDGLPVYRHALAMSLANNGLAASPAFVFPATSADWDAAGANTGVIPEGALMMLPASFDASRITDARLSKIVATLKTFGARVVDRNTGTPFVIYVENGSNFSLMPSGWDNGIAAQLDFIRAGLRQVAMISEWVDARGAVFTPPQNLNLLSMRGAWTLTQGSTAGVFDTWEQAVLFPDNGQVVTQTNRTGRSMPSILNTPPRPGQLVRLTVHATQGAWIRLELWNSNAQYNSGNLVDGAEITFAWPAVQTMSFVTVGSGAHGGGKISATVIAIQN